MEEPSGEFSPLDLVQRYREQLDKLNLPDMIVVASGSKIKIDAVAKALKELYPQRTFVVEGAKHADSEIEEQPVNEATYTGAHNRLKNAEAEKQREYPNRKATYVSIENGIFERKPETSQVQADEHRIWEDKSVVEIKLSDGRIVKQLSAGVRFPTDVVIETQRMPGGFKEHTVGSRLFEKGIVKNKQDPHSDLTNGAFTREQQMVGAIKWAFIEAATSQSTTSIPSHQ